MGTTAIVALIVGRELYLVHVGDSQAYLIRDGRIQLLTVDHTRAQAAIEAGQLTREQAADHPNRLQDEGSRATVLKYAPQPDAQPYGCREHTHAPAGRRHTGSG